MLLNPLLPPDEPTGLVSLTDFLARMKSEHFNSLLEETEDIDELNQQLLKGLEYIKSQTILLQARLRAQNIEITLQTTDPNIQIDDISNIIENIGRSIEIIKSMLSENSDPMKTFETLRASYVGHAAVLRPLFS